MGQIEPDLTLDHVRSLKEKYAGETPEEHQSRIDRYKKAFATYREKRDHYFALFKEQVRRFKQDLNNFSEATVREGEKQHLEELESHFAV